MKKISVVLFIFLQAFAFISCVPKSINQIKQTENSVQNISEEEIVKGSVYSKSSSSTRSINNKTTMNVKYFNGIEKVVTFSPRKNPIEITVSSKVDAGDLRIVLCDDSSIIYEFAVGEKNQSYRLNQSNSKYYLKTVGSKARFTLEFNYESIKTDLPNFDATIL